MVPLGVRKKAFLFAAPNIEKCVKVPMATVWVADSILSKMV